MSDSISILAGGHFYAPASWSATKSTGKFDNMFGFDLITEGCEWLETSEGKWKCDPGYLHFIPIHHWTFQACEKGMTKCWILFSAESFYLRQRLLAIRRPHRWALSAVPWVFEVMERFTEYFQPPPIVRPREDASSGLELQIEGMLTCLTGKLIEATESDFCVEDYAGLERLRPAIKFMDEHYLKNPSIPEIAQHVSLAPTYFHRLFKLHAGVTPFRYMETRRLDFARSLLIDRRLNISEVADRAGYTDIYYFSRAVRRRFGTPPSKLKIHP
jgi:AraC-like DNA-binding protein